MADAPLGAGAGPAAQRWAAELAGWAIPDEIIAQAPEPPWFFPPEIFRAPDVFVDSPSRLAAREALPDGGSVLDVGCGGGAAGLALVPPAGRVVGFDPSQELLDVFAEKAQALGVEHRTIRGSWPADAASAPASDVVVSHHVVYNVADLVPFVEALTKAARRRVVVEMSASHPLVAMAPLWKHFWDLDRPSGPTAETAMDVLTEAGIEFSTTRSPRPPRRELSMDHRVAFTRRRLCLGAERDAEVQALLPEDPNMPPGESVAIWWPGTATA